MLAAIDKNVLFFINRDLANPALDYLFIMLSDQRFLFGILGIIVVVMIIRKIPHTGNMIILCLIGLALTDPICSQILKKLVMRPRPCHSLSQLREIIECGGLYGFPSNHAANSAVIAYIVSRFRHRLTLFMWLLAAAVGISRIYLAKHYPSDVLAGFVFGILVGMAVLRVRRMIAYPRRPKKDDSAVGSGGDLAR